MQYIFQYPDMHGLDGDMLDAGSVSVLSVEAERAGFVGFAFTEHPAPTSTWLAAGGHQTLDPFVALGHVAAVTTRLRLLTYLTVLPYRNPLVLAKAAATVDRLSNGRLVLGTGTGYLKAEYFAVGADFAERNELFDEALDVMPLAWSGEPFDYEGRHFNARNVVMRPPAAQQPIPIWIGGNSTRTLRRVAERGQGWMPLIGAPEMSTTTRSPHIGSIEEIGPRLDVLRDLAGDRFAELDIAVGYTDRSVYDVGSDTERHCETFATLATLGVTQTIVPGPPGPAPRASEFIEAFGQSYIGGSP